MRRFGVSLEDEVLRQLDQLVKDRGQPSRSEAIRHLVRGGASDERLKGGQEVAGCLVLIYDHHKRDLLARMTALQHDHQAHILASQHVHLTHHLCLETIVLKGRASDLQALSDGLCSLKGVHQGRLVPLSLE